MEEAVLAAENVSRKNLAHVNVGQAGRKDEAQPTSQVRDHKVRKLLRRLKTRATFADTLIGNRHGLLLKLGAGVVVAIDQLLVDRRTSLAGRFESMDRVQKVGALAVKSTVDRLGDSTANHLIAIIRFRQRSGPNECRKRCGAENQITHVNLLLKRHGSQAQGSRY